MRSFCTGKMRAHTSRLAAAPVEPPRTRIGVRLVRAGLASGSTRADTR
jgi:hypothetical protein